MVRSRTDNSDLDAVLGIPTGVSVKDVDEVARVEIVDGAFAVDLKRVLVHLDVD